MALRCALIFAQETGWHSPDSLAHWYYNAEVYDHTEMVDDDQELMITGSTACTAYLFN
jgi:hypothetical protein